MGMFRTILHRSNPVWKTALAAGLSWDAALLLGAKHPFFAPLAAILCLQVTVEDSLIQAFQRTVGIIGGVVVANLLVFNVGVHDWSIALVVLAGIGIGSLLRLGEKIVSQIGVTALLVLTVGPVKGDYSYGMDRIWETVVGALFAVAINMLIVPPDFTREARDSVIKAADELANHLKGISAWLHKGAIRADLDSLMQTAHRLLDDIRHYEEQVNEAFRAAKFSPLLNSRRAELKKSGEQIGKLKNAYLHSIEMMEIWREWTNRGKPGNSDAIAWSKRYAAYGEYVDRWKDSLFASAPGESLEPWNEAWTDETVEDEESLRFLARKLMGSLKQ